MTKSERDSEILRLRKEGMKLDDIAEKLGETPSNVRNIVYRARSEEAADVEFSKYQTLIEENRALEKLKAKINVGDRIRVYEKEWTVCAVYPHTVLAKNLKGRPCLKCIKGGGDCERLCRETFEPRRLFDICREYWKFFEDADRCTPMYMDISRVK